MRFSELPEQTRVKLTDEGTEEFWHRVDEFGGVKQLSDSFGYSSSKMYNWRSKDSFLPIDLVRKVFGNEASDEILAIKGKGRSRAIQKPKIPLPINEELATRASASVHVNRDGTPIYQTDDLGNANRFIELLEELGEEVPYRYYSRASYEVQYPKFLHQIIQFQEETGYLPALVDEKGVIEDGIIELPDREIRIDAFDGELYSRDKRLQIALQKGDEKEVQKLMQEQIKRTQSLF